jgi:hypothetical protein
MSTFTWRLRETSKKLSRIADIQAEFRNQGFQNTKQKCCDILSKEKGIISHLDVAYLDIFNLLVKVREKT